MARRKKILPSLELILERYRYDPLTGIFYHARKNRDGIPEGSVAAANTGTLSFDKKHFPKSSIAWKIMTGEDPEDIVDHKDGNRKNHVWTNLRSATQSQNAMNRAHRVDLSRTGVKGVYFNKNPRGKKYRASIRVDGRKTQIGTFHTLEEAAGARKLAEERVYGEFRTDRIHEGS